MKYILLIGDGMGDLPVPELGNATPLEAADKPAIDRLAREGEMLLVRTVPNGFPPGSDVANLSLLGYEPEKYYTGRAPLEAASMGVAIGPDEIAYRCNLVTVEYRPAGGIIMRDFTAGHISSSEAAELITAVQRGCGSERFTFHPGISYRHLLVVKNSAAAPQTVPPHDHTDQDVTGFYRNYLEAGEWRELMTDSAAILSDHPVNVRRTARGLRPANSLWPWGEGRPLRLQPFEERYGIRGSLISAVDLLKGIGICCGLEIINVEGATGFLDTNYEGKAAAALEALRDRDFVLVHVEAPDEAGHQGMVREKVRAIEDFDGRIVRPIVEEMERRAEPFRLVVTMDHYTPICRRTHEDWPVPMVLYDSRGTARPAGLAYTEANAIQAVAGGGLSLASGADFFARLLDSGER
ncbi:MAG TPA: cofactor-independent phosphoglycerate mutase [Desulfobacteraceae bacterium]|nr:cofactor-independent phosphoglycerate mutase [Desulfobacteraceae bacterium]